MLADTLEGSASAAGAVDLPLLPLRQAVLFPGAVMPLAVGRTKSLALIDALVKETSDTVVVGVQSAAELDEPRLADLSPVGVVARVIETTRGEAGGYRLVLSGLYRVALEALTQEEPYLRAQVTALPEGRPDDECRLYAEGVRALLTEMVPIMADSSKELSELIGGASSERVLANLASAYIDVPLSDKLRFLEAVDTGQQLRLLLPVLAKQLEIARIKHRITATVREGMEAAQRSYYLRQQLKTIRDELKNEGGGESELDLVRVTLEHLALPDSVRALVSRTVSRIQDQSDVGGEYGVALKFLQHLAALPWTHAPDASANIQEVRTALGRQHFGADDVIDWVLEELAVRRQATHAGQVLCLVGPPGVGKTSIARAIADAIGRPLYTISLAGVYDATFIRGHRRTYLGSEPGAFTTALQTTGTMAPVIVLDEIDKAGQDAARGDLRAALLAAIDPILNHQFVDDYLGITLDLSQVLFIATANRIEDIYPPLRSRMRIITFWGYSPDDKLVIARDYLLPRTAAQHGLPGVVKIDDEALRLMIVRYTQEAGVRELSRLIERICRKSAAILSSADATKTVTVRSDRLDLFLGPPTNAPELHIRRARVGRVNAIIVGDTGGAVEPVDSIATPGKGTLTLTGSDSDAVRERTALVLSVARHRTARLRINADAWTNWNLHVHVNATVSRQEVREVDLALYMSIVSTMLNKAAPERVGVIGAVDLHGEVRGCREFAARMAAAQRHDLEIVIVPNDHRSDIPKLPRRISDELEFRFVGSVDEAVDALLGAA